MADAAIERPPQRTPFRDGDAWCVMIGDDLQHGVSGFGDTPAEAQRNFLVAYRMRYPWPRAAS